jgi:uncharacterized repeat protein (TIGR03806 family)
VHSFFENAGGNVDGVQSTDLTDRVQIRADGLDERGLLGIALHPEYPADPRVFLAYTTGSGSLESRVSSFEAIAGDLDPDSEIVLLEVSQPYTNHNGGHVIFGPDGFLYAGLGDGGSGGDPQGNGQNTNTWLGSILRIDVDQTTGDKPYAIPTDNPFAEGGGAPEIYAYGLRNPWRFTFDRDNGDLWAGDVGQDDWEEIDIVERGGNYGWNLHEGFACYPADVEDCASAGLEPPIHAYRNPPGNDARSVTGGYVYRGSRLPELVGRYVFADYATGEIWQLEGTDADTNVEILLQSGIQVSSFAEDQAGELYVLDRGGARVLRVDPGDAAGNALPARLSDTGCVNVDDPTLLASNVIAYDVALPFWSDGVQKQRYLVLPEGKTLREHDDGDLEVPNGTLLIKNFVLGERVFETRFYVRHADGEYSGYSYAWNAKGDDAELVETTRVERVGDQDWVFPGRDACNRCHTAAAGRTLGLELRQLNLEGDEPQLSRLHAAGAFDEEPSVFDRLPEPGGSAPLVDRARAYLHVNCAGCHRPGGPARGGLDLRFDVALGDTGLCETAALGDLETSRGALLAPGVAEDSVAHLRMSRRDQAGMPPLGSNLVDEAGATLIAEWIDSLDRCP